MGEEHRSDDGGAPTRARSPGLAGLARQHLGRFDTLSVTLWTCVLAGLHARRFWQPQPSLTFADDFYYYAVPAAELLRTGVPSFDGVTATNGFHPLWFSVQVVLIALTGGMSTSYLAAVSVVLVLLNVVTLLGIRRLCATFSDNRRAVTGVSLYFGTFLAAHGSLALETSLVVALLTWFLLRLTQTPLRSQRPRALIATGGLFALCALARLDAIILLGVSAGVLALSREEYRPKPRHFLWLAIGVAPLLGYLIVNVVYFGGLTPVSGVAKQLTTTPLPSFDRKLIFFGFEDVTGMALLALYPFYVACVLVLVAFVRSGSRTRSDWVVVGLVAGTFATWGTHCVLSAWELLFWYYYPLYVAAPVVVVACLDRHWPAQASRGLRLLELAAIIVLVRMTLDVQASTRQVSVHAEPLTDFAHAHPGVYAMGDRAGTVGYELHGIRRVIHLEGFTMDREFLDQIRRERDLKEVLQEYDVDYYVSTTSRGIPFRYDEAGCVHVREPTQRLAGADSHHMHGVFCSEPALVNAEKYSVAMVFEVPEPTP